MVDGRLGSGDNAGMIWSQIAEKGHVWRVLMYPFCGSQKAEVGPGT